MERAEPNRLTGRSFLRCTGVLLSLLVLDVLPRRVSTLCSFVRCACEPLHPFGSSTPPIAITLSPCIRPCPASPRRDGECVSAEHSPVPPPGAMRARHTCHAAPPW